MERLLQLLTGQESQLAMVASTLLIAGLFAPLRGRVQELIDRRFYRRKYDAVQTLAAFPLKARDEVDLEGLTAELLGVVDEVMQPSELSIWLRQSGRRQTRGVTKHKKADMANFYTQLLEYLPTPKYFLTKDGEIDQEYPQLRMHHLTEFWRRTASAGLDDNYAAYVDYVGQTHTS